MNTLSPESGDMKSALRDILSRSVISLTRIGKGRNSQVFHVVTDDQREYAVKSYFDSAIDQVERMGLEFDALKFLSANNVSYAPCPIAIDHKKNIAIYEYIDGDEIDGDSVTEPDIAALVGFLVDLKRLVKADWPGTFPPAREASFSLYSLLGSIERRIKRLQAVPESGEIYESMRTFLSVDLTPSFKDFASWSLSEAKTFGMDASADLPDTHRTYSPSDVGFHNAIRKKNGEIVFLDFEYFGWDDPSKTVSDILLHPNMALSQQMKNCFYNRVIESFASDKTLGARVRMVYSLYGIKWCAILLNEFLPDNMERRLFAARSQRTVENILLIQLGKSRAMLDKIRREFKESVIFG
ncbi:FIG00440303: hypothetical protein [hydrothermal vent metagenome]|uniref:Aminoglycoside phosphotransferase domain-containing protein n=1 Tax=hydrothermal vent metagenome TaxID=652676 RepID=A0A3B1CQ98_9ZZZZ